MNLTHQHWNWIAVGFGLGTSIGMATGDMALWMAVGTAFGAIMAIVSGEQTENKNERQH